ncbi:MAG: hypothetical protein E7Z81_06225 [Methanobrevibacter sp.]|nr:hypothetical protein [Methanobrevibacter sp.]
MIWGIDMVKHLNKIFAISAFLLIFLLIIPGSFANENQTDLLNDTSQDDLISIDNNVRTDVYFDASAGVDGDGSKLNPYNTINPSRLKSNTNIHVAEGQYDVKLDGVVLENCSIYGENPLKTVISSSLFNNQPNIIAGKNFDVSGITFLSMHFEARDDFTASNTIFDMKNPFYVYEYGFIRSMNGYYSIININNCTFTGCTATYSGGAIYMNSGSLNVEDSIFSNNGAYDDGGAIWLDNANSTIRNSFFEYNGARDVGGAIYSLYSTVNVINSTFSNNYKKNSLTKSGAAIYSQNSKLTVSDSCFENNTASSTGGAIDIEKGTAEITSSSFINNYAEASGGAINVNQLSDVKVSGCSIEKSSTDGIGAALFSESSELSVKNTNITDSHARFGAALTTLMGNSSLNNVIVKNSASTFNGGAVYQLYGTLSLENSQFTGNIADKGGALYLNTVKITDFTSNSFSKNDAKTGLDMYMMASDNSHIDLSSLDVYSTDNAEFFIGDKNYTLMKGDYSFNGVIPERYNSADKDYVTSVKNQGDAGYCWAFTAMAVLEAAVAKATGVKYDFSENNLVNLNKIYSDYGLSTTEEGGNLYNSIGYLVSWLGPIDESIDPYDDNSKISPVLNSLMHVQNAVFIQVNSTNYLSVIKEAVMRYGAVGTGLYWDYDYGDNYNNTYYFDKGDEYHENHAVTIVGWDDTYSKDNFKVTPPGDGAWIVKNSWGPIGKNKGYFYVSYYTNAMNYIKYNSMQFSSLPRLFAFIMNDTIRFDKNYQYDYAGATSNRQFSNGVAFKNVFRATDDEYLAAVSTYFMQDTEYEVSIYLNGELVHNQSATTGQGYYTINLDKVIQLKKDDTFEVAFKMTNMKGNTFAVLKTDADQVVRNSSFREGISFYNSNQYPDVWTDTKGSYLFCIKAFTVLSEIKSTIDLAVDYGDYNPVTVIATVLDESGNKINSGTVTFTLNGTDYTVNVTDGIAKFEHKYSQGISKVSAAFEASGYVKSSSSVNVDVTKVEVDLDISVAIHSTTATVTVQASQPINESIEVMLEGKVYRYNLQNGKTRLDYNLANGEYDIKISISNSDRYYGEADKEFAITVTQPRFVSQDMTTFEHSMAKYSIKLVDDKNSPISSRLVKFNLNGEDLEVVTDANGDATIIINLTAGKYDVSAIFEGDDEYMSVISSNAINVKNLLTAQISISKDKNNATVEISLSKNVNANLTVSVNNKNQIVQAQNGKATLKLNELEHGEYEIGVYLNDDDYVISNTYDNFTIDVIQAKIIADDFTTLEKSNVAYSIRLVDGKNQAISNKNIKFKINGNTYTAITDSNGEAEINIDLAGGEYEIISTFEGDDTYLPASSSNMIKVKTSLTSTMDIVNAGKSAEITVTLSGDVNVNITFDVNGKIAVVETKDGRATLKLDNLENGDYEVTATMDDDAYYMDAITDEFTVSVVQPRIISYDIETYENSSEIFLIRLVNSNYRPIAGKTVRLNLNNKEYEVITDEDGEAGLSVNLSGGNYNITATFDGDDIYLPVESINTIKVRTILSSTINVKKSGRSAEITAVLSKDVEVDLIVSVNGENHTLNSKDTLKLNNLDEGEYDVDVYLNDDDYIFISSPTSFSISVIDTEIVAEDFIAYYGSSSRYIIKLKDSNGNLLSGKTIRYTLNGNEYSVITQKGAASIPVDLSVGTYDITFSFDGEDGYMPSQMQCEVIIKSSITLPIESIYTYNAPYSVSLIDSYAKALGERNVNFEIDGIEKQVLTDRQGIATLNIDLGVGNHVVKVTNPSTGEVKAHNINVMPRLSENKAITMYYGAGNTYKVKVLDDNGNAANGVKITVKVGSSTKSVKAVNGYATLKITSKPGKYTITAIYKDFKVSSKLTVRTTLVTKNIAVKKGKTVKFTAKLLNTNGKILKNKKVTFKFSGKTYKIKTNSKGIATLKVTKKLKVGKYTIKTAYGKLTVSNKITIKR